MPAEIPGSTGARQHISEAEKNSKPTVRPFIKAIQEHGPQAFMFTRVDDALSQAELNEKEVYWIEKLNTRVPNGFNATRGGQGLESGKSITVGGSPFKTLTAASQHTRVPLSTASRRLKTETPEQAFGLEPRPKRKNSRGQAVAFTHDGTDYHFESKRAAAAEHRIPEKRLQRRLAAGWSILEALELVERPGAVQSKPLRIRLRGKMETYPSYGAAARAHRLPVQTLIGRLRSGWSVQRALLTPPGNQGRHKK